VFGVSAVISILGIGEGAQRTVMKEIAGLGLNNIIIDSASRPRRRWRKSRPGADGPSCNTA